MMTHVACFGLFDTEEMVERGYVQVMAVAGYDLT